MTITTTSLLPSPVQQSFSQKLLSVPVPYLVHKIVAELKNMPANGGTTLRMRRYNPLATCPVPLGNSGVLPAPQTLSALNIDAVMSFYGTYIWMNEQVTLQNQDPALNEATIRLGVSLRQTEDQLMRDMMLATSTFVNCVGGADGDNPTEITRSDVDYVVRTLRGNAAFSFVSGQGGENKFGTAPVRDAYFGLAHTNLIGQLDRVNGFVQKWNYPNQQSTLDSEWGVIANIRFLLSSVGSVTPSASMLGADVYNCFCCGRESVAAILQDKYSANFIYRPAIYDSPLAMNCSVGYRFAEVPRILNDSWILNLRMTLA
jgi:N4-gp56 family major capsid protein